ncbi:hypothetical protein MHI43_13030 [Paenibacillus sp. FSL H8-0457]|uniref:hypothetical protein n=1 Tax=unclassified Paenibacillus TaxID=185978 RepID=UPI0003E21E19|nr:hypothetical protein [Paenibacillus sp. FSL H8-457]ETT67660.1 hypothetical protein C172_05894 [Paenibacillus sp. FSL H8-457]
MKVDRNHGVNLIHNIYHEFLSKDEQYILDSNVVVNMEKAFYEPSKMRKGDLGNLMTFLKHIKNENVSYDCSHALSELSIDLKEEELERRKYYNTRRAVNGILKMSTSKLEKHVKYHQNKELEKYHPKQKNDEELITSIQKSFYNTSRIIIVSYLPLLKFYQLVETHGLKKKEKIYREILEYMTEIIGSISVYELAAMTFYLFSSDEEFNNSQSLMKVNNKIELVKKAWNVSWDMSFLRIMNNLSGLQRSGQDVGDTYNRILATNDQALTNLAEAMISDELTNFDGKYVSNIRIDPNSLSPKYRDFYLSISNEFNSYEKISERKKVLESVNPEEKVDRLINLSASLIK